MLKHACCSVWPADVDGFRQSEGTFASLSSAHDPRIAEVAQELAKLQFPHIYPDPEARRLRAALAEDCGVPAEYIMAGAR